MNAAEHFICSSALWRYFTGQRLLPWLVSGVRLGDHALEIGAGYGAATMHLRERVQRVTAVEYDHNSSVKLRTRSNSVGVAVVRGTATHLPFACESFSSAVAILVLHHLESAKSQDQMFVEVFRVLRPGGVFVAFEIPDSWVHRVGHIRSMFTPIAPASLLPRLSGTGFSRVAVDVHMSGFRIIALRPE
ncbi:MAG: class I SAM-dependent methyltransferase [Candidatus Acidiferrum sp.]